MELRRPGYCKSARNSRSHSTAWSIASLRGPPVGIPQSCWATRPLAKKSRIPKKPSSARRMQLGSQTARSHRRWLVLPPKNTWVR
eukprot:5228667-Pyramimonas_sp.AAC.1